MLKSAILSTTELDMSWVLGLCVGGGLKEALDEVLIFPARGRTEREREGGKDRKREEANNENRRRQTRAKNLSVLRAGWWKTSQKGVLLSPPHMAVRTHTHTPRYLALGTSSTGPEAACASSTLGALHLPP